MRVLALVFALLAAALLAPPPSFAQLAAPRKVQTELVSARAAIAPGETFTIALRQTINEHWHTYWRNPGAAGEPTDITWTMSGFEAGEIQWPAPEPIQAVNLWNYGYSDEVLLPVELTAPANLRSGESVTLSADIYLVVCSDEICVPEESQVTLTLPVAAQGRDDPQWTPRIAETIAALPRAEGAPETRVSAGTPAVLSVAYPEPVEAPYFFPRSRDALDYGVAQEVSAGENGFSITLPPGVDPPGDAPLEGLLTFTDAQGARHAYDIVAQPGEPLPGTAGARALEAPGLSGVALIAALGFAFLGGLILNIMPCVLPVLSVKALSFAGGAQAGQARRHGLLYAAGVLTTFLALAALLLALRGAGEAIGWGFQLQSPWVNAALALLFFAIGLNLLGVFEIGGGVQNAGAGLTARGGDVGAFFTGALAVVAATPCTAPFMAGAIGAVLTQPAPITLVVFAALALGFAAPLTLLAFAPELQRAMPKPGPWMERVKQVLAFPMFAAAIWVAWVLTEQSGAGGAAALLALALALGFVLYVIRWGRVWLVVGIVALAATTAWAWRPLNGVERAAVLNVEPWSPARLAALRAEGRPVFVNFTAAWCVTCKLNEAAALSRPRVGQAFADRNVAYLEGDWTNRDNAIAAALAEHGRAGVPLYLYYPSDGEAIILPQVLSEEFVLRTLEGDQS